MVVEIFDDIRKIYRFSKPCEELQPYIEFFSESCADATGTYFKGKPFSVKMFASYTPTIWINLGPAYRLSINNTHRTVAKGEDILLVREAITERINQPGDHIFTIKFYPGGMQAVLGLSQQAMAGRIVPLHHILPQNLISHIKALQNFDERLQLVQQYFLACMHQRNLPDHYTSLVQQTIASYTQAGMQYNVSQAAAQSFITSKTINRYFNRVIGTSPKQYLSVIRARTALTQYVKSRHGFEPTEYGYYDASHFHKEVLKFTGQKLRDIQA